MIRQTFTPAELVKLRLEFGKIERASVDCLDAAHAIFDRCNDAALIQLARDNVKFISMLARNACTRRGLQS